MKKMRAILNNKKGAYSILAVILILIMVAAMTAFSDIVTEKWALNEVQSIMDTSGINTLQNQVNNKALRAEIFSLDTSQTNVSGGAHANVGNGTFTESEQKLYKQQMAAYYKKELARQVKDGTQITDYNVERVDVNFSYDNWGLGSTKGKLPQITLDSVVRMKVSTSTYFDTLKSVQRTMYSSRNNANFTVTYNGRTDDGKTELIVRSVTRLVYR